jgi:hypothetical protein
VKRVYLFFLLILLFLMPITPTLKVEAGEHIQTKIHINLWNNTFYWIKNEKVVEKYPISCGNDRTPTPIGLFKIVKKAKGWGGGFGTRWLGLNVPWGTFGIHGTNKPHLIGKQVSSGCIRMRNEDIEQLYPKIALGTPVHIDGPITGQGTYEFRTLSFGSKGNLVQLVQNRLRAAGIYKGPCDGI